MVETIDFFEDEDLELPPPMTQKDVILLNRAGAFEGEEADAQAEADKEDDDAMEVRKMTKWAQLQDPTWQSNMHISSSRRVTVGPSPKVLFHKLMF